MKTKKQVKRKPAKRKIKKIVRKKITRKSPKKTIKKIKKRKKKVLVSKEIIENFIEKSRGRGFITLAEIIKKFQTLKKTLKD